MGVSLLRHKWGTLTLRTNTVRTAYVSSFVVYDYYYNDGLLMRQTWGSNYIDFLYDESGLAYSFIYNDTQYYYIKNLQNDVIAIANASGSIVVNYTYEALVQRKQSFKRYYYWKSRRWICKTGI